MDGGPGNKNYLGQLIALNVINHGGHMPDKKQDLIDQNLQDLNDDGVDGRALAWSGL